MTVLQFGRSWFSAYTAKGKYLAMGSTKREAAAKAELKLREAK